VKMAKPSERDIEAAGDLMSILHDIDKGYYPERGAKENAPTFFDEEDPEHLRAFYDAVKATLDKGPGYPGRVIGGMCYVIMWDKNEIVDPAADVIELHPRLVEALSFQGATTLAAKDVLAERRRQVEQEGWHPDQDDDYEDGQLSMAAACYAMQGNALNYGPPEDWPWDKEWWKPTDDRRNLVKAAALILADIERIDRATAAPCQNGGAA
jgi:hypothetical protein